MIHTIALLLFAVVPAETATWPAFLGAGAQSTAQPLPLQWSPAKNIAWRSELPGHGQSSPVVWGPRLFVTSVSGEQKDTYHILCLDLLDGRELWRRSLANSAPQENSHYVSRAAPTPVVDAQRVIVFFESGDCVAYSHSGEELWSRQLSSQYGPFVAEFGLGASPCQTSAHVFVLLEHDGPSYLLALDKGNGEVAWAAERTPRRSWSSPAIIQVMGQPQVVVSSAGSIDGYDPQSGELLWTFSDVGGNTGTTPIDCGQGRFLVGASAGRNGQSAAEAKRSNGMLQVERTAEGWHARRLWVAEDVSPSWASPIVYQGFAYWVNRAGVIFCFDAQTGEQVYAQRSKQPCWATPLASQERLYFFGKSGLVTVIAAGREFNKLAENQIWDEGQLPPEAPLAADEVTEERRRAAANFRAPTLYGYAVANGRLVARVGNQLFCIAQAP